MHINQLNVRVYGLAIWEDKILISDEFLLGKEVSKFPGGGLEFGEGTKDCLEREFMEETGQEISQIELFYINDFFQVSFFNPQHQLFLVYYSCAFKHPERVKTSVKKFDFQSKTDRAQSLRWQKINTLKENEFYFPIDKMVVKKLLQKHGN